MSGPQQSGWSRRLANGANLSQTIIFLVAGAIIIGINALRITPVDIYSTALYLDSLEYNRVFNANSQLLTWIEFPRNASEESVFMAVGLYVIVVGLFIYMESQGSWVKNQSLPLHVFLWRYINKGTVKTENVNWNKVGILCAIICLTIFDTYTDSVWKTGMPLYTSSVFWRNVLLSFFLQTILSEAMWILGPGLFFAGLISVKNSFFSPKPKAQHQRGKPPQQSGGKPSGKPPQGFPPGFMGPPQGQPHPQTKSRSKGRRR